VLYRLPEVLRAETVCICEGEKDADNVFTVGLCGTTAPQGAGKWGKLCKDHRIHEPLKGKTVYVLPDNDGPGRNHAHEIAKSLHGFASSVKILDLKSIWPTLSPKGDVSDFIEAHGPDEARRMLLELAARTREYVPDGPTNSDEGEDEGNGEKKERPSRFKVLMGLLDETDCEFFHDQFQSPWVCVSINGHRENIKVKSGKFKNYLIRLYFQDTGEGCGRETLQQVQDLCSAKALYEGEQRTLSVRAAWQGQNILIDLGGPDWKAIEITAEGWRVIQPKRPPFRRFSHMKALPEPKPGGAIEDILNILPIQDETSQILIRVWLPTLLLPDIPRPGLVLAGLQGSGKTFASERLRELIDPSEHLTQSLCRDEKELVQSLDHNYLPCFDNLTSLPLYASNMLCRAVTGGGYDKRELYSDDEDVCYSFCRPFLMNGISVAASRPDLLDRVLICELTRISTEDRKPLKRLMAEFKELQPKVLAAILDAISGAMRIKDTIELETLHRLADWQEWAAAVAEATGIGRQTFLTALETNISRQHSEVNSQDPTAVCVLQFMADHQEWSGTPTELYAELAKIAENMKLDREQSWPKAPNTFTRKLKGVSHNLAAEGIEVTGPIKVGRNREKQIILTRISADPTSNRQEPSAGMPRADTADDTGAGGHNDTVRASDRDNYQESLQLDDADDADDVSGYSAGLDERLQSFGCRENDCLYLKEGATGPHCSFSDPAVDLTGEDAHCERFNPDGTPKAIEDLPFALTDTV